MKVIQIIDGYKKGDGVGNVVSSIADFLDRNGIENTIFKRALIEEDITSGYFGCDDIVLYNLAVSMDPLVEYIPCKKILVFHNITIPELLGTFDGETRMLCECGWFELKKTRQIFHHAIAFSNYSKQCLIDNGWDKDKIDVLPIYLRINKFEDIDSDEVIKKYNDDYINILFTGRVYPNKKHEDLISAFAEYKEKYNNFSRLILVGNISSGSYYPSLVKYAESLGVGDSVVFTGRVSLPDYKYYYSIADVFLCLSEHEGFCIPLVEAMFFDVPIVAYNSTAIPDTLGGAGVLLDKKNVVTVAQKINDIVTQEDFRNQIISGQQQRLKDLSGETIEEKYKRVLFSIFHRLENIKSEFELDYKESFHRIDVLPIGLNDEPIQKCVIYGAGAAGSRIYARYKNLMDSLLICDNGRAGEYDEELKCIILNPIDAVQKYKNYEYIVSIQDRRVAYNIANELMDGGIDRNQIHFYDRLKDQLL